MDAREADNPNKRLAVEHLRVVDLLNVCLETVERAGVIEIDAIHLREHLKCAKQRRVQVKRVAGALVLREGGDGVLLVGADEEGLVGSTWEEDGGGDDRRDVADVRI